MRAAREAGTLSLGFHLWPCLSVYHLHLHLIFPMPARSCIARFKFPQAYASYYVPPEAVAERFCGAALVHGDAP